MIMGSFRMKAPKLRLPLLRTTPPQATRRRKLSRRSPHRASPPCTCLSRPPAWSSTARTSCATASSLFQSPPTWSSPPALSRTSMWRRWTLTRRDTTLEVNSSRWVLALFPWSQTNGQSVYLFPPAGDEQVQCFGQHPKKRRQDDRIL